MRFYTTDNSVRLTLGVCRNWSPDSPAAQTLPRDSDSMAWYLWAVHGSGHSWLRQSVLGRSIVSSPWKLGCVKFANEVRLGRVNQFAWSWDTQEGGQWGCWSCYHLSSSRVPTSLILSLDYPPPPPSPAPLQPPSFFSCLLTGWNWQLFCSHRCSSSSWFFWAQTDPRPT